jgi:adenine-specific DNA-methyltransferase
MGRAGTKRDRLRQGDAELFLAGTTPDALLQRYQTLLSSSTPEAAYSQAIPEGHRKRFAQFFTPPQVAELMIDWIAAIQPAAILDPAVGPGIFPRLLSVVCPDASISCLDVDELAAAVARRATAQHHNVSIATADFLTWENDSTFDAVIANPPYLRHHDLNYAFDVFDFVGRKNATTVSRLSNSYVLFVLEIVRRLRAGGRAAILIPGEWVNANFGANLKLWLIRSGVLHTLIYFSHASSQFDGALTTASILLIEKPEQPVARDRVQTLFVQDGVTVGQIRRALLTGESAPSEITIQNMNSDLLLSEKKWNHLLEHGALDQVSGLISLSEIAKTSRGIATGCNSFFHLNKSSVQRFGLRPSGLIPCVGRAGDVVGAVFSRNDYDSLLALDRRVQLLSLTSDLDPDEKAYIERGVADGLHLRYLCAARKRQWFAMESRPPAPIWAAVFGRNLLRFVHNAAGIANLTTFHCIYPFDKSEEWSAAITTCLNSGVIQRLSREQYRVYGGGLLKMEPKDLLDLRVPDLRKVSPRTIAELAALLGKLDAALRDTSNLAAIREEIDRRVLACAHEAASANQTTGAPVQTRRSQGLRQPVSRMHRGALTGSLFPQG